MVDLGTNSRLSLEELTVKTAWLLAMVGFLRPSDLERIDLDQCTTSSANVLQLVIVAPKETRQGSRITKTVTIHPHANHLICPVSAYKEYQCRVASSAVLVPYPVLPDVRIHAFRRSLKNHSAPIGPERISKHIQPIMQFVSRPAGCPLPEARALGATLAAQQAGVSVDDIVVHGNWSSQDLFENFYRISSTTANDFTTQTLNQQQRSPPTKCNVM
ncbi:hypothetical protein V8B55DRAFT_1319799 [Mucor lusitanicus]|nr:hypothetical protein FB192DRAFT_1271676 [Mucor lusitanicus]